MKNRRHDPLLKTQPWKVMAVFGPIECIVNRISIDGTVQSCGRQVVFREDSTGWYDAVEAIRGVIEFHKRANALYPVQADVSALEKLANRLDAGAMVFDTDLPMILRSIASCKRQAYSLRVSQAESLVRDVQLGIEFDKIKRRVA